MRYMTWIDLRHEKSTDDVDLMLDYTSMMQPTVIFESLRRKHYLVSSVTIASLLLKIQIVLSSGLYELREVSTWQHNDVRILDTFNASMFQFGG